MANKQASNYIRRVAFRMPIIGSRKKQFLATLEDEVTQFMAEFPQADYAQLEAQFGTPDDIAADFISQMPCREINRRFRIRNRLIVITLIIILFISISTAVTLNYIRQLNREYNENAYIVYPTETLYPKDFAQQNGS